MPKKKYKGIRSSVKSTKSAAAKSADARKKRTTSTKRGYKGLESTAARAPKRKPTRDRRIRIMPLRANIVDQPPETELSRRGLSLKKLLRTTPRLMKHNAQDVQIKKFKKTKTKSGLPAFSAVCLHKDPYEPYKVPKERETYIIGLDSQDKPVSKQRRVMCSCNCENWTFTWEYANTLHGAAKIIYGNGDSADMTNPANVPGLCKHLTALAYKLIEEGK